MDLRLRSPRPIQTTHARRAAPKSQCVLRPAIRNRGLPAAGVPTAQSKASRRQAHRAGPPPRTTRSAGSAAAPRRAGAKNRSPSSGSWPGAVSSAGAICVHTVHPPLPRAACRCRNRSQWPPPPAVSRSQTRGCAAGRTPSSKSSTLPAATTRSRAPDEGSCGFDVRRCSSRPALPPARPR